MTTCAVCGRPVPLPLATDVGTASPEWVGNDCLLAYFVWVELQSVTSYVERYERVCPLGQGV